MTKIRSLKNTRVAPASGLSDINERESEVTITYGHEIDRVKVLVVVVLRPSIWWSLNAHMLAIYCSKTVGKIPLFLKAVMGKNCLNT